MTPEQMSKKRELRSQTKSTTTYTRPQQSQSTWRKPEEQRTPSGSKGEGSSKTHFEKKKLRVKTLEMEGNESSDLSEDERELIAATLVGVSSDDDEPDDDPKPRNTGKRGGMPKNQGFRTRSL